MSDGVVNLEAARAAAARPPRPPKDRRPVIRLVAGAKPAAVSAAAGYLAAATDLPYYQHGGRPVRIVRSDDVAGRLEVRDLTRHALMQELDRLVRFERYSKADRGWVDADCPDELADRWLSEADSAGLRPLVGTVSAPTLRSDGSLLDVPGYDAVSRLHYDPCGVAFPAVDPCPTRGAAISALDRLKDRIATFPFVTRTDIAVMLSAMMTALSRRAMPVAPMHAFTTPVAGTGKGKLVTACSLLATGAPASPIAPPTGHASADRDFLSAIDSAVLSGRAVVSIDNATADFCSPRMCQCLTERHLSVRLFHTQRLIDAPNVAAYYATGNNLVVSADLVRRVLLCALDAGMERPETREFADDFDSAVLAARGALVADLLTLSLAFFAAGAPRGAAPLGSYFEWSRLVRDPLIWLGEADPVASMDRLRTDDPVRARLIALVTSWWEAFADAPKLSREVIEAARRRFAPSDSGDAGALENPDLHDALVSAAGRGRGELSSDRLGAFLRQHRDRPIELTDGAYAFVSDSSRANAQLWRLTRVPA
jgi:putative DNA primase/helicase